MLCNVQGEDNIWNLEATPVTQNTGGYYEERRFIVDGVSTGTVYCLKFPDTASDEVFSNEYSDKLFENTSGVLDSEQSREQVN